MQIRAGHPPMNRGGTKSSQYFVEATFLVITIVRLVGLVMLIWNYCLF